LDLYIDKECGLVKDLTIYDLKDTVMGEYNVIQIIDFSSLTVKPRYDFRQTLPVKISHVIFNKVTCKLSHTIMLLHLVISFDRGHE